MGSAAILLQRSNGLNASFSIPIGGPFSPGGDSGPSGARPSPRPTWTNPAYFRGPLPDNVALKFPVLPRTTLVMIIEPRRRSLKLISASPASGDGRLMPRGASIALNKLLLLNFAPCNTSRPTNATTEYL